MSEPIQNNMREQRRAARQKKKRQKQMIKIGLIAAVVIGLVLVGVSIILHSKTPDSIDTTTTELEIETENPASVEARQNLAAAALNLEDVIFGSEKLEEKLTEGIGDGERTVFLAVSNGENRAHVIHAKGETARDAYDAVMTAMDEFVYAEGFNAKYVRVDFVSSTESIAAEDFPSKLEELNPLYKNFFRYGIAFDSDFSVAVTEAEINANDIIDYDVSHDVNIVYLNRYFTTNGSDEIDSLPSEYILFTCAGYAYDGKEAYVLNDTADASYGIRVGNFDSDTALSLAASVYDKLIAGVDSDGKLDYGVMPVDDTSINDYNLTYHAEALYSMANYGMSFDSAGLNDEILLSVANYLKSAVVEKDAATAFVADTSANEISLTATARTASAFVITAQKTGSQDFDDTIKLLGNGMILALTGNSDTLYYGASDGEDFAEKTDSFSEYSECVVLKALCDIYGYTQDETYLNPAKTLADKMVTENYAENNDPELSVALNELTKYAPTEKYFTLALDNIFGNMDKIATRQPVYANFTQALLSTYEIYRRIDEQGISIENVESGYDFTAFIQLLNSRIAKLPEGYAYPETAMYLKNPDSIIGSYISRNDNFRCRIDDCGMYINVLLSYAANSNNIESDTLFVEAKQSEEGATAETVVEENSETEVE